MCGRYVSTASLSELAEAYGVDEIRTEALGPRYNVAPTQPVYAVVARRRRGSSATRLLGTFRWGLVPGWAKDRSIAGKLINARSEGIDAKPAFRSAFLRRRCILPAESWYEWQAPPDDALPLGSPGLFPPGSAGGPASPSAADGPASPASAAGLFPPDGGGEARRRARGRRPFAVRRRDGRTLAFAGLWEVWRDPAEPDAEPLRTATIVTTAANQALAPIHGRMPVVLAGEAIATWLDPDVVDPAILTGLLLPAPEPGWETWPVSTRVNNVAHEGPDLLDPLPA
jgi:putative SOS response-associated peptidase YedK